jgi:hypothetical protein
MMNVNERLAVFNDGKARGRQEALRELLSCLKIARSHITWRYKNDKSATAEQRLVFRSQLLDIHNKVTAIEEELTPV